MRDPVSHVQPVLPVPAQARTRPGLLFRGHRASAAAAAAIVVVGVFYLLTIRPGHAWGDDFAMYIHHAKNLVEGVPYQNTGHIVNYHDPGDPPASYPPGLPLLLVPVYKVFGLNLTAMKAEVVLLWLAALAMLFLVFRRDLPAPASVGLVALAGFNPFLWDFKDQVLSDLPFLFFLTLAIHLIQTRPGTPSLPVVRAVHALGLGLAVYLAYSTRSVGAVLVATLLVVDLLERRRLRLDTLATLAVFAAMYVVTRTVLGTGATSSYLEAFAAGPAALLRNLASLPGSFATFWDNGYSRLGTRVLVVLLTALAATGYLTRVRRGPTVLEVFPPLYLLVLVLWPYTYYEGSRYLIPLFPWFLFYVFVGVAAIRPRVPAAASSLALAGMAVLILLSYAGQYTWLDFGPIRDGVTEPEAVQLFAYVRERTALDDVFIFSRPLALALFGGRSSSSYWVPKHAEDLWTYAGEIHATHLVIGKGRRNPPSAADYIWFPEDGTFLRRFASTHQDQLLEVFSNADFVVYRIVGRPLARSTVDPGG